MRGTAKVTEETSDALRSWNQVARKYRQNTGEAMTAVKAYRIAQKAKQKLADRLIESIYQDAASGSASH